jgi:hypothetical protein
MQRSDTQNLEYYIGPGMGLVFQSLGTLIALLLAFLGLLALPFRRLLAFFRKPIFRKGGPVFFALLIGIITLIIIGIGVWVKSTRGHTPGPAKRVIVLGMDGLDPKILEQMMDEGKLPNFSYLKEKGTLALHSGNLLQRNISPQLFSFAR